MGWIYYNPNPSLKEVGDCVVRAISIAMNRDWESTYLSLTTQGYSMHDMPSSNDVWGTYLSENGFKRYAIPNECPICYTIRDFCIDHPKGLYVLATGTHVVTVIDGNYYDSYDSGKKNPVYFFTKEMI